MKTVAQSQVTPSPEVSIRILKIASCPSLSGNSTLTYHIGCRAKPDAEKGDAPEIFFRVFANSGGGYFSNEWIAMGSIHKAFATVPAGIALTAHLLSRLFQGKSANTQGFLFAVLKHEGLVCNVKDSKGLYGRADASSFIAEVKALIESAVDLKVEEKLVKSVPPQTKGQQQGKVQAKPDASSDATPRSENPEAKPIPEAKSAKLKPRGAR